MPTKLNEFPNEYRGFHPEKKWTPPILDEIKDCIGRRMPCILELPVAFDISAIADTPVQVEVQLDGKFGHGKKVTKQFAEFISQDEGSYLNTQYENETSLLGEFLSPPLTVQNTPPIWEKFPQLVPHQVNLWMGKSSNTSSGLHHDFHDNLYFLVKGRKNFTIFSPKDAQFMYLEGIVKIVHRNGMIEYVEEGAYGRIRDDGAYLHDAAEYNVAHFQEQLDAAEARGDTEAACLLEEQLDYRMADLSELQEESLIEVGEIEDDSENDQAESDDDFGIDTEGSRKKVKIEDCQPASFSKATLDSPNFPLLQKGTRIDFELKEGQCLYLPCGWFHNVTSFPQDHGHHVALNLWTIPPQFSDSPRVFYADDFWRDTRWKPIQELLMVAKQV